MDWYDPHGKIPLSSLAFKPFSDKTGLSLDRARIIITPEHSAALGKEGKDFYIAVLCAGELRKQGMNIIPAPTKANPGHAVISNLTCDNRKEDQQVEWKDKLATHLCQKVLGPFPGKTKPK